jgi:hypothetical protein
MVYLLMGSIAISLIDSRSRQALRGARVEGPTLRRIVHLALLGGKQAMELAMCGRQKMPQYRLSTPNLHPRLYTSQAR